MTKIAEGAQGESRRGSSRLLDLLAGFVFLSLGLGVVLQPYVTMHKMPGDLGDASFNLSLLEFFYRTLSDLLQGKLADFVDAPFYYPWPRVTNFSDTHWGDAEVYALFRALGMNLITAFQAWFIAAFGLTYLSTFVSLRMLSLRAFGAAVGAFVFTFCLPMMAQVGHAQLIYRLWIPPRSSGSASVSNSPEPARRLRVHAVLGTAASGQHLSWALSLAAPRRICRRPLAFCKKSLATAFMAMFFSRRRSRVYRRRFPACSRLVGARCRPHPILQSPIYVWVFAFLGRDRGNSTASWLLFARRRVQTMAQSFRGVQLPALAERTPNLPRAVGDIATRLLRLFEAGAETPAACCTDACSHGYGIYRHHRYERVFTLLVALPDPRI